MEAKNKLLKTKKTKSENCCLKCVIGTLSTCGLRTWFRCASCFFPGTQFYARNEKEKIVYMTIDDFPSRDPSNTLQLLTILDKHDVKCTFFVIKYNADLNPQNKMIMRNIVGQGHEFGNHMSKDRPYSKDPQEFFEHELLRTEQTIVEAQPKFNENAPKLFRPPSGAINKKMQEVLVKNNYVSVLADDYTFDAEIDYDPDFHIKTIVSNVKHGSILLLHTPENYMRHKTFEILDGILPKIKAKGFTFKLLSSYFQSELFQNDWNNLKKKYSK
jgi:peptidoglycan/xylan/chitin deacetylase (PgdA/CDA1 family)